MLFFYIRHGIPIYDPDSLTELGKKQADALAKRLSIYGIDKIEGKELLLPVVPGTLNKNNRIIRNKLANLGLNEVLSYSLIPESEAHKFTLDTYEHVRLMDPMSEDRSTLRYSILPSLINVYNYNKARGNKDISIYEVGKGFYKKEGTYYEESKLGIVMTGEFSEGLNSIKVDFYVIKVS